MNIHTFKDAATSRRQALADEVEDDDDDDREGMDLKRSVEGEEEEGYDRVSFCRYQCKFVVIFSCL